MESCFNMKRFLALIYSVLIYPLLFILFHAAGLFNSKIRKALLRRYGVIREIKEWREENPKTQKSILFHCASMGEFEHIKPLIRRLNQAFNTEIILTFFSPSGYRHVKNYPGVSLILYAPFDFSFIWKRVYRILQTDQLVISKHDVWPGQVWAAQKKAIPAYLVNASLHPGSSRSKPAVRFFMKYVYRSLTKIYAISKEDERRFLKYFPQCATTYIGDTKFDQALIRKEEALDKELIDADWAEKSTVLLFGSVWPEDTKHILPALKNILEKEKSVKVILVPHQPQLKYVLELLNYLKPHSSVLYSKKYTLKEQRVLIVDAVGVLADLYKYAQLAYVGGSFRQGIHNVMEAAVYGIPVLYGPQYKNSLEAVRLLEFGGSVVVQNERELQENLLRLIRNKDERKQAGGRSASFALQSCGATEKLLEAWRENFSREKE